MVDTLGGSGYVVPEEIRRRRQAREDFRNPIDPEKNFRQWRGLVGLPSDFPTLKPLNWESLNPRGGLYLGPFRNKEADLIFQAALSPLRDPYSIVMVQPGHGTTTLERYTLKRMVERSSDNISAAELSAVIPVSIEMVGKGIEGVSLEEHFRQEMMRRSFSYGVSLTEGMSFTDLLAKLRFEDGFMPQFMVDLSETDMPISHVVGEMKDMEEKAARELEGVQIPFGQMYFGSKAQYGEMISVYNRYTHEFDFRPFIPMEVYGILARHTSVMGTRGRYANLVSLVDSTVMDRAYATLFAEGRTLGNIRLVEAVTQFRAELLKNMDARWEDITFHQQ